MTFNNFFHQIFKNNYYLPVSEELFNNLKDEGFIDELNNYYEKNFKIKDFEFFVLNISNYDRYGLIAMNEETIEKYNKFDIELKNKQKGYPTIVDFIDYENGNIYIVKLKNYIS